MWIVVGWWIIFEVIDAPDVIFEAFDCFGDFIGWPWKLDTEFEAEAK